jgi:hypothetical protein
VAPCGGDARRLLDAWRLLDARRWPSGHAARRLLLLPPPSLRVVAMLLMDDEPRDLLLGCPDDELMDGPGSGAAIGGARAGAAS